ncbi:MAG: ATP-binding protein [Ignavibacteriales bacterium]|nr:ATP-binding protein [Ignavibacteriales bacterium]
MIRKHRRSRPRRFAMECPSDPKHIGEVERFLQKMNESTKLDDGTFYRVLVASTEAVNNAILHGNKCNPEKKVIVICLVTQEAVKVQVRDEGGGFDARRLPDPLDEKNLLKEHGRGVFLMNSMTDRVRFRRLKKGMVVEMLIDLKRLR